MATSGITDVRRPKPIKTILAGMSAVIGIVMLVAYFVGAGDLTPVFAILAIGLLLQAAFYWRM